MIPRLGKHLDITAESILQTLNSGVPDQTGWRTPRRVIVGWAHMVLGPSTGIHITKEVTINGKRISV